MQAGGIKLLKAELGRHVYDPHTQPSYAVITVTAGAKRIWFGSSSLVVGTGQTVVANPEQIHGCEPAGEGHWAHRTFFVDARDAAGMAGTAGNDDAPLVRPLVRDPTITYDLVRAHRAGSSGRGEDAVGLIEAALSSVFAGADREAEPGVDPSTEAMRRRVNLCREVLLGDLSKPFSLDDLTAATGVSRSQVVRDFRRAFGTTPARYLRVMRLRSSMNALAEGTPLAAIAVDLGFSDQSHFSRVFKAAYGTTPRAFLR